MAEETGLDAPTLMAEEKVSEAPKLIAEEPSSESPKLIAEEKDSESPKLIAEEKDSEAPKLIVEANGSEAATELEQKIIKQIEFYFGDVNLPRDKFLQQELKADDGWITWETMKKFKRLCQLSDEDKVLTVALKKSTSGLMEINEDSTKIRRSEERPVPAFDKERRDDLRTRSIYIKGFPTDATLDEVEEFLEKAGKIEHIQMRKDRQRGFKGSCFVIFAKADAAKNCIDCEELAKYGETETLRLLKEDYFKKKDAEKKLTKQDDIKKKQDEKEKYLKQKEEDEKKNLLDRITRGAILHMKNIPDESTREDLKSIFEGHGEVAWVEFDRGDTEAKLRFQGENSAKGAMEKAQEANDGKIKVKDQELECKVLEGEEELDYWKFMLQSQKERRDKKQGSRRGGRGGHFGGGGRGRSFKRRGGGGGNWDEPRSKVARRDYD